MSLFPCVGMRHARHLIWLLLGCVCLGWVHCVAPPVPQNEQPEIVADAGLQQSEILPEADTKPEIQPTEPESCQPGDKRDCELSGQGMCKQGFQNCEQSGTWGTCIAANQPTKEVCDQRDNDCDGEIDEDCCKDCCFPTKVGPLFEAPQFYPAHAVSPDLKWIAYKTADQIDLYDLKTGKLAKKIGGRSSHLDGNQLILFHANGKWIAYATPPLFGDTFHGFTIIDHTTGKKTHELLQLPKELIESCKQTYCSRMEAADFSYVSNTLVSIFTNTTKTQDRTEHRWLVAWSLDTGKPIKYFELTPTKKQQSQGRKNGQLRPILMKLSKDGRRLFTANTVLEVEIWDLQTEKRIGILSPKETETKSSPWISSISLATSEDKLSVTTYGGEVFIWNLSSKALQKRFLLADQANCSYRTCSKITYSVQSPPALYRNVFAQFSPNGEWFVAYDNIRNFVQLFEAKSFSLYQTFSPVEGEHKEGWPGPWFQAFRWSKDSKRFVFVDQSKMHVRSYQCP